MYRKYFISNKTIPTHSYFVIDSLTNTAITSSKSDPLIELSKAIYRNSKFDFLQIESNYKENIEWVLNEGVKGLYLGACQLSDLFHFGFGNFKRIVNSVKAVPDVNCNIVLDVFDHLEKHDDKIELTKYYSKDVSEKFRFHKHITNTRILGENTRASAFWVIAVFQDHNTEGSKSFVAPSKAIIIPILSKHHWQWAVNEPAKNLLTKILKSMIWYESKVKFEFNTRLSGIEDVDIELTTESNSVSILSTEYQKIYQSAESNEKLEKSIFRLVDDSINTLRQKQKSTG